MDLPMWIGPDESLKVGDIGFLIEFSNTMKGSSTWILRDTPAQTNQSHKDTLFGWCGTYNDVATNAHGLVKVIRMAKNCRALVLDLRGDDLAIALEELGYPGLYPKDEAA